MQKTRLGRTGLEVSVASLGTGGHSRLGQANGATFDESVNVVKAALEHGVNFIDTAAGYGTEDIVGAAIAGHRDEVIISTKNHIVQPGTSFTGTDYVTGDEFARLVDGNLSRLGTDYIDVLHLHGVCANQYDYCVAELVPVLDDLRRQGKIRFTAISERFYVDPRHEALERALEDDYFDVMMVAVNIINQSALRHVIPAAKEKNIGIQAIYAVRGRLASIQTAQSLIDEAIANGEVDASQLDPEPLAFLEADSVAGSLIEACYRFDRHAPGVDTVVTGTGSVEHLLDNIAFINGPPLPEPVIAKLAGLFGRVELVTGES